MMILKNYLNLITSEHTGKQKYSEMFKSTLGIFKDISDCAENIDYNFDLDLSQGDQLDVIGNIVGAQRILSFQPTGNSSKLRDEDFRFLIKSKIAQNTWDGSTENLINIWKSMFPNAELIVYDNHDMSVSLMLLTSLSELQIEMLFNNMLLPKPGGVTYGYTFVSKTLFGYNLETSQYNGYNIGYWEGRFKIFAFDMDSEIFGGLDQADFM